MHLLIIDNYDSFTYNLVRLLDDLGAGTLNVIRNDQFSQKDIDAADAIVLSPGPGLPAKAGRLMQLIADTADKKPMLGVCLGMQALAEHFGGSLHNLKRVFHGVSTPIRIEEEHPGKLLEGIENGFEAGRYHSWAVNENDLPDCLQITARDESGEIMGIEHKELPLFALQFHPESVLTPLGPQILSNFLKAARQSLSSKTSQKQTR